MDIFNHVPSDERRIIGHPVKNIFAKFLVVEVEVWTADLHDYLLFGISQSKLCKKKEQTIIKCYGYH